MIADAVHGIDRLKAELAACEAAEAEAIAEVERRRGETEKKRAKLRLAESRLRDLIASGTCGPDCGHDHSTVKSIAAPSESKPKPPLAPKPVKSPAKPKSKRYTGPIAYRLAFMLLENPVLDYGRTAAALWGPLDKRTAKNRISSQLAFLRKRGIITTLGSNRYQVNAAKLAECSGMPVEGGKR
jgi:hypothetical protein